MIRRLPPRPEGFDPRPTGTLAMVLVLAVVLGIWLLNGRDPGTGTDPGPSSDASSAVLASVDPDSGLPYVRDVNLPEAARETLALVRAGEPLPDGVDGVPFGNDRDLLPAQPAGYYTDYPVDTPGSADPGVRHVVQGDRGELYWTADRYASFARIRR